MRYKPTIGELRVSGTLITELEIANSLEQAVDLVEKCFLSSSRYRVVLRELRARMLLGRGLRAGSLGPDLWSIEEVN